MTHKQAVARVTDWLRHVKRRTVVITELRTHAMETPDVIAWQGRNSTLVEIKVSRSDFHADKKKSFRRYESMGMGNYRYFAAPKGILKAEDIPSGWGLLEIHDKHIREIVKPEAKDASKSDEVIMLISAIRRLELSTAVFVRQDRNEVEDLEA